MSQAVGQLCEFWHVRPWLSTLPAGLTQLTPLVLPGTTQPGLWLLALTHPSSSDTGRRPLTEQGLLGLVSRQVGPRAQRTRLGLEKAAAEPQPGPPPRVNWGWSPRRPRPLSGLSPSSCAA